jgi:hypothetical protein
VKKTQKKWHRGDQLHVLAAILTRWWHPVASTKALDLLYQAMHAVLYRRTTRAIKMARKVGPLFCCFVCCHPGGCWGDAEQVVARWQHPVASGLALGMLHHAMPSALLRRTTMTIKMANDGGTILCDIVNFIIGNNCS